ncbi:MAG: serine/threonine protein kinase [Bdellovibrionaceae bacterium]|nr:serine/threonine protein kinase [Pseudobdellovibrionaceae bacterium]
MDLNQFFYQISPEHALQAVEKAGYHVTGRYFQLNSFENRVFDVELEDHPEGRKNLVVKIYRPERWTLDAIQDELQFLDELANQGIPVIKPLPLSNGEKMGSYQGLEFALFNKVQGRLVQELTPAQLRQVGRKIAQIHSVGEQQVAENRINLTTEDYGWDHLDILENWIAPEVKGRYMKAAEKIFSTYEELSEDVDFQRIHGDCHKGNLLIKDHRDQDNEYFFVDFDDFLNGPAIQDFWMLLSGPFGEVPQELNALISGYQELRHFDEAQIALLGPLQGLRIIQYAAWIARRWKDPLFPQTFPQFRDYIYWAEEVEMLESLARG